jgi:endonuclease/exonuclease/phosphatase (EEP) superfamily protein YafD
MRILPSLLAAWTVLVLALVAAGIVVRPQTGPLALVVVVEGHLLASAAVTVLVAAAGSLGGSTTGARRVRLLAAVALVVVVVRLGGEWYSPGAAPAPAGSTTLTVLSWNLEHGSKAAEDTVAGLRAMPADVVALQELTPASVAAIAADESLRSRYPYRVLEPPNGSADVGILSRLPIVDLGERDSVYLPVDVLVGGETVRMLVVHPFHPVITRVAGLPLALDARTRDADLRRVWLAVGRAPEPELVIVAGDLNTSPFEPGFAIVADELRDAHEEAGVGPGFTWRPSRLETLGVGFLRIDHVLSGARWRPIAATEDCSLPGDHCRLLATLVLEP